MAKNKTITIITTFYYPEDTAIGLYTTQFSRFLVNKGYTVKIITGFPNYPQWIIHKNYMDYPSFFSETIEGIEVFRYKQYIPKTVTFKGRVLMMLSLFYGTLVNLRKVKHSDLVICIVPFTLSIVSAWLLSKIRKAKLWVHIQDFEFDLALESGVIGGNNPAHTIFKSSVLGFERFLLNRATLVSSISLSMLSKINEKSKHDNPYFFPNWVSSEKINPEASKKHPLINSNKFTLLYSGNIGEKQNWDFLYDLCLVINPDENIEIAIVGDGGFKNKLIEKLKGFAFVQYYEPVPYDELNDLLCSADVHFLFQKTEVLDTLMPSKILGMMASKKPSIISGNKNSEVLNVINQSQGGFYFSENDILPVYQTILELKNNPALGEKMGLKARNYILEKFNAEKILADFEAKITTLI